MMKKKCFFSLSPRLLNEAGHDANYQRCLEDALGQYVAFFNVYIHSHTNLTARPKNWIPFFQNLDKWHGISYRKIFRKRGIGAERRIFFSEQFSFLELCHLAAAVQFWSASELR